MKTNNLLASVALFRHLYDHEGYNNMYDILADFIRGAIIYEGKLIYTSQELKEILKNVYDFEILDSVIKTTIKVKFEGKYIKNYNTFTFDQSLREDFEKVEKELREVNQVNNALLNSLYNYISEKKGKELNIEEKSKIFENFSQFTMDNGHQDEYSDLISAFIISNSGNSDFTCNLNSIREGIILYQGVSYTANLNELGKWETDLDIFLAPEHLFHALGYNGELFKEIFLDFYTLVKEINQANKPTGKNRDKKIKLYYLPEAASDVKKMFYKAESIVAGKETLLPTKNAMEEIVKNAKSISDVKAKQIKFFLNLESLGIHEFDIDYDPAKHSQYNVVDQQIINELEKEAQRAKRPFEPNFCYSQLNIFSKINYRRRGVNNVPFEKISVIYLTENSTSKYLAHRHSVKFQSKDIAFAKDIDFIISRFWFKLKKGFKHQDSRIPKSFDLINKARIVISAYTNNNIAKRYEDAVSEFKSGKLTKAEMIHLNIELRSKTNAPELVTEYNIDDTLSFLADDKFIEYVKNESDHIKSENKRKDGVINELSIKLEEYERKETEFIDVSKELSEYKRKEEEQRQLQLAQEKKQHYTEIAESEWNHHFNHGRKCALLAVFICACMYIAVAYGIFKIEDKWEQWLGEYDWGRYIIVVMIGSYLIYEKYFAKESNFKQGVNWLTGLVNKNNKKAEFIEARVNEQRELD
ncbi:hypothetical protein [Pedobacter sp.]|uniref:hypothetical protein n=1 Tax=Pedobacter sp. TaxID=1411316 RepID=UPI00396C9861